MVLDSLRQHAGHVALGITLPAWLTSILVSTEPLLHWLALLVTIVSGVAATVWYAQRIVDWFKGIKSSS